MFDANTVLLCLALHLVRLTSWMRQDGAERFFRDILLCYAAADRSGSNTLVPVLFRFQELLCEFANGPCNSAWPHQIKNQRYSHAGAKLYMILPLAIELGMINFIQVYEKANAIPLAGVIGPFPLLFHATARPFLRNLMMSSQCPIECPAERMVPRLLSAGCDPNKPFTAPSRKERTPWLCWLGRMHNESEQGKQGFTDPSHALQVAHITESFLKASAHFTFTLSLYDEALDGLVQRLLDSDPTRSFLGDFSQQQERMLQRKDWEMVADAGCDLLDLVNERRLHLQRDQGILRRMRSGSDEEWAVINMNKRREL